MPGPARDSAFFRPSIYSGFTAHSSCSATSCRPASIGIIIFYTSSSQWLSLSVCPYGILFLYSYGQAFCPVFLDVGYSHFSTRKDARVDDRGQIVVIEFIAYDHDPIITFAIADAMGNLQYQHPIDFATYRPIILNELHDVHFRWHDASEEQAEKYWQVRMTTDEKE